MVAPTATSNAIVAILSGGQITIPVDRRLDTVEMPHGSIVEGHVGLICGRTVSRGIQYEKPRCLTTLLSGRVKEDDVIFLSEFPTTHSWDAELDSNTSRVIESWGLVDTDYRCHMQSSTLGACELSCLSKV